MRPLAHGLKHRAGQFAFFSFELSGLRETHPFTISSAPQQDGTLRISVGALGDYTKRLASAVELGTQVKVQGPFGHFTQTKSKRHQIWVAGGIGITPFLAWLDALPKDGPQIDLIYSFRGENSAAHLAELHSKADAHERVTLHIFDTSTGQRPSRDYVENLIANQPATINFCGPKPLRESLIGLTSRKHLRFEEFEIRTGLPFLTKAINKLIRKLFTLIKTNISRTNRQT